MELLFKRNISDALKKMLLCAFALCAFATAGMLQAQSTALPVLSWGVNRDDATAYGDDITKRVWYPDNRIWVAPKRVAAPGSTVLTPESEILVPVFIDNRWANRNNVPGVTLHEISSFSFRVYYDSRTLDFVEVVKEHPFTAEEATNLVSTHFFTPNNASEAYYKPLGYNFNITAAVNPASDYGKYFNASAASPQDAGGNPLGRTVTITGTANSFFNLPTTDGFKVLVYLKFKVANAYDGVPNIAAYRTSNLYFDPTYICYNSINIAKDRGDKLIEQMPLSNTDVNWNGFVNMFGQAYYNLYIGKVNDNMKYMKSINRDDFTLEGNYFAAIAAEAPEVESRSVGLVTTNHNLRTRKWGAVPYLPASIQVRVMNYVPEFTFDAVNYYSNIVRPAVNITQSNEDPAQWTMVEPITADLLQSERANYKNQSERAIRVTIESNKADATALARDNALVMENIIIETDQPWLKVRTMPHLGDPTASYEDKFSSNNADYPRRRAFAQRINRLISTPNDDAYNPFVDTRTTTNGNVPKDFIMWVECDPALITPKAPGVVNDQDLCGEYIGNITFRSKYDKYEKTSIQVRFIVIASPEEKIPNATETSTEVPYGLKLTITPNDGKSLDLARTLVLGTSDFATDQSDSLAGEYVREQVLGYDRNGAEQAFDARFYIDSAIYPQAAFIESGMKYKTVRTAQDTIDLQNQWRNLVDFGFGDYTHRDGVYNSGLPGGVTDNKSPRTGSRDIRSTTAGTQSHMFFVKFRIANDATDWFPVVLRWDPKQIQAAGNTCFLKYIHNGGEESVDMKTQSSFVFHDIHVNHFWIEYTVSKHEYDGIVDNFGDDVIQSNAWNLVSLPLDPVNKHWKSVYPNTVTIPYEFNSSNWQEKETLEPGVGYFVKYLTATDAKFQGAYIDRIDASTYPVRLLRTERNAYWNAIGALSKVVSVDNVDLAQYDTFQLVPEDRNEMIKGGLWAYRPKEGYKRVYQLFPGKGYFIRVTKPAYLVIDGSSKSTFALPGTEPNYTAGFDIINIADASQHNANVFASKNVRTADFALPPAPPLEMFDVRFAGNNYATDYDSYNVVKMQGVTYPVTISLDKPKANYSIVDPITNEVYGIVKAGTNGSVVINSSSSNSFKLQIEGSDESFFVTVNNSPVNTNTADVTFGINSDANVSLSLFNSLGDEVLKTDLGYLSAGVTNYPLDVANLATGVYTVRLLAGGEMRTFMMHIIK